jgi:hypothetical protein
VGEWRAPDRGSGIRGEDENGHEEAQRVGDDGYLCLRKGKVSEGCCSLLIYRLPTGYPKQSQNYYRVH